MKSPTIDQPENPRLAGHLMMLQHLLTELIRVSPDGPAILKSADRLIEDYTDGINRGDYIQVCVGEDEAISIGSGANFTLISIKADLQAWWRAVDASEPRP